MKNARFIEGAGAVATDWTFDDNCADSLSAPACNVTPFPEPDGIIGGRIAGGYDLGLNDRSDRAFTQMSSTTYKRWVKQTTVVQVQGQRVLRTKARLRHDVGGQNGRYTAVFYIKPAGSPEVVVASYPITAGMDETKNVTFNVVDYEGQTIEIGWRLESAYVGLSALPQPPLLYYDFQTLDPNYANTFANLAYRGGVGFPVIAPGENTGQLQSDSGAFTQVDSPMGVNSGWHAADGHPQPNYAGPSIASEKVSFVVAMLARWNGDALSGAYKNCIFMVRGLDGAFVPTATGWMLFRNYTNDSLYFQMLNGTSDPFISAPIGTMPNGMTDYVHIGARAIYDSIADKYDISLWINGTKVAESLAVDPFVTTNAGLRFDYASLAGYRSHFDRDEFVYYHGRTASDAEMEFLAESLYGTGTTWDWPVLPEVEPVVHFEARLEPALADNTADDTWTNFGTVSTPTSTPGGKTAVKYRTNRVNGHPAWVLDAATASLVIDASGIAGAAGEVFVVMKAGADPGVHPAGPYLGIRNMGTSGLDTHMPWTDNVVYWDFASTARFAGDPGPSLAAWHVLRGSSRAGDWRAALDGNTAFMASGANVVAWGPTWTIGDFWQNTEIAAMLVYNRRLTDLERQQVLLYLGYVYGVTISAPIYHI